MFAHGVFNSGSYMLNLDKMRRERMELGKFTELAVTLRLLSGHNKLAFLGDQGLMSAAFAGDMQFYAYPQRADPWYMPYNFCMWYFDRRKEKPDYEPRIVHYCGSNLAFKPQAGRYPSVIPYIQKNRDLRDLSGLEEGQREYYLLWYEHALETERLLKSL